MKAKLSVLNVMALAVFAGLMIMLVLMWSDISTDIREVTGDVDELRATSATTTNNQLQIALGLAEFRARQAVIENVYNVDRSEILDEMTSIQLKLSAIQSRDVGANKSVSALNSLCPDEAIVEAVQEYADITSIFWAGVLALDRGQTAPDQFAGFMGQALQFDPELLGLFQGGWTREIDPGYFVMRLETKFAAALANAFEPCRSD